jgi:hypothetical protein
MNLDDLDDRSEGLRGVGEGEAIWKKDRKDYEDFEERPEGFPGPEGRIWTIRRKGRKDFENPEEVEEFGETT